MTNFERNESALIEKKIGELIKQPKIGIVDQVYEHNGEEDDSNFEVDLLVDGKTVKEPKCPVLSSGSDTIAVPKKGDKMLAVYTDSANDRPVAFGLSWSNKDRASLGRSGLYKNSFDGAESPSGEGDLHITGYTSYDKTPASNDKRELKAEESVIQISKNPDSNSIEPNNPENPIPAKIEMYDSKKNDQAWISVEMNKVGGEDSDVPWGMKFNIKTGEWRIVGPKGFGISSDGAGNFIWEHKDIVLNEVSGDTGNLSL